MPVVLGRRHCLLHVRALLTFSIPNYYIKKGRPHGHRYGKKLGDHEYFIASSLKKKCKKKHFLGIHDRFIRDERFRKSMIELGRTEEVCREMDKLANEDHTHHITPDEIRVYRNNWWIRSNIVSSDTMPVRHRADFIDAILEDKVLMMTHLDLQKRFPIYHVYPKCLAPLLCGTAIRKNASTSLQVSDEVGMTLVDW